MCVWFGIANEKVDESFTDQNNESEGIWLSHILDNKAIFLCMSMLTTGILKALSDKK